ncbi:MAG: hypothetical protein QXU98_09455 [Candidatus Parvarchaeota archaeon]
MGLGKTLGITIFIIAVIFVGVYLFYNNQQQPITIISSQQAAVSKSYQDFKSYISSITNIPVNNIINTTPFPEMTRVIFTTPQNETYTKYPYGKNYICPNTNFSLIFPQNSIIPNIPKNTIVPITFAIENQSQSISAETYNFSYIKTFPKVTIDYYVVENGLNYTFNIYNPNHYIDNLSILESISINTSTLFTIGFTYNNKFYIILYK